MNVKIKRREKIIKPIISRSPNGFLRWLKPSRSGKPQSSILWFSCSEAGKRIKNKSNFAIKSYRSAISFAGITHRSEAEKKISQQTIFCSILPCNAVSFSHLRKNSLLFPNPQPVAKALPAVGPKFNKPVVWKGKFLGWRRAQNGAEGPHSPPRETSAAAGHHCFSSHNTLLTPGKRKGEDIWARPPASRALQLIFTFLICHFVTFACTRAEFLQGWLWIHSLLCLPPAASASIPTPRVKS